MTTETDIRPAIEHLARDLAAAAASLTVDEARFFVDTYYELQHYRIASLSQSRQLAKGAEPPDVMRWLQAQMLMLEHQTKRALDRWSDAQPEGRWAKSIAGIGPVLASGLLAHIDIAKAPTAGHIWRFAGLDPTVTWKKKTKRPWNARLKVITWKIGESFVKVSNNDGDVYGHVYAARKELETARNDAGDFAAQAAAVLAAKKIDKDTDAYKAYILGKLPPAHIHSRAKRYAVKLFLSAYHEAAFFARYDALPPLPYILTKPEHTHYRVPPNMHLIPGWEEARASAG
ncbi:MAG: TIGR-Tas system RNA-guided endonuclease [Solirubrobacteraceae bacterium]